MIVGITLEWLAFGLFLFVTEGDVFFYPLLLLFCSDYVSSVLQHWPGVRARVKGWYQDLHSELFSINLLLQRTWCFQQQKKSMTVKRLQLSHIRDSQLYLAYLYRTEIKRFGLKHEYICVVYFLFDLWLIFCSSGRDTRSRAELLTFLTSKKKRTKKREQKWNVALTLFLYIWKKKDFLHYLVMNENFCGVILDVLLCVLTKLVFLPSQNIQYSSISTVLTSCKLFIVLWPIRH